ncbi:hypothetical protein BDZ97DRAFT_1846002 [Flammula alnicola]|nr:hypothetical protein BDZ97DRAFT_1846002 [Flammula alnicola]
MDINFLLSSLPHSPPNFQPAADARDLIIMSPLAQTIQDFLANGNWSLPQSYEFRSVIDWTGDPANDARLLDWIDKHPLERDILFSPTSLARRSLQGKINKHQCFVRAAKHFFFSDNNPAVRRDLKSEAGRDRLAHIIRARFCELKRKYQDFNSEIGPAASNMQYEELIKIGGETRQNFEDLLEELPIWPRLHTYWRALPGYNLHYSGFTSSPSPSASPSPFGTIRKIMQPPEKERGRNETERSTTSSVFVESKSRDSSSSPDSEVIIVNDLPKDKENKNVISKGAFQVFNHFVPGRKSQRNSKCTRREFEEEEDIPSEINNTFADDDKAKGLTAIQKYELQMAEIQLKRQKLELEVQEKKTAVEIRRIEVEAEERRRALDDNRQREKEKHEIMIHFMALVTGSSSKENIVEQLANA